MDYDYLIKKYNIPVPRYTSYPTVPFWDNKGVNESDWKNSVKKTFDHSNKKNGISLYIHLPYCENICTYCGCNKIITKNHNVEKPYIETVLKEWDIYLNIFKERPNIKEIHLGGGTPTFFNSLNLKNLIDGILSKSNKADDFEFSIEAHPNVTGKEQLIALYNLGFSRLSLGVQDFDPDVQFIINRIQPYSKVKYVTDLAREIGFDSINFDLVYGLPLQKKKSVIDTVEKVLKLMPDRIAFYSYAHVPWKSPGQRRYTEKDLPTPNEKRELYEIGKEMLEKEGYIEIGMDHFSLPSDSLYKAQSKKELHRNFMGYTSRYTELSIGLGVSSISDTWEAYSQNTKSVEEYKTKINKGIIPSINGYFLNIEDMIMKKHILNLMCNFETYWDNIEYLPEYIDKILEKLIEFEMDGLIFLEENGVTVTQKGKKFIRNICSAFDTKMYNQISNKNLFSKSI